jgi:hypothetical protein
MMHRLRARGRQPLHGLITGAAQTVAETGKGASLVLCFAA